MVSQCPIIPGDAFIYNFTVPNQAGTFWYHSHLSVQYCDGLRGPLVIYDDDDPLQSLYDVDNETTVITLADWYHEISTVAFPKLSFISPVPDSTLINGLGRYTNSTTGNTTGDLAVFTVKQGLRYRFRLVAASCNPSYTFSIDGHNMTVIEADGVETEPVMVQQLHIFAAQRYSIVVNANQSVGNYWIRANPITGTQGFANGINSAILRYQNATPTNPNTTMQANPVVLNEADLSPLDDPAAPGPVDVQLTLDIGVDNSTGLYTVNGTTYTPPPIPVLLQILSGNMTAQQLMPAGSIYEVKRNQTVEITMPDFFPVSTPFFWMHDTFRRFLIVFSLLASDASSWSELAFSVTSFPQS